jgi:lipopolysaccharide export system protein LptC
MAGGRADTYDQRAEILGSIVTRNRVVGALRIIVPALGAFAFVALAGQIFLANMTRQFGVSAIRIDRGNVVVETPQYTGTSATGSRYIVNAREARSPLDRSHVITMNDATLELVRPSSASYFARTAEATMDTRTEIVVAPGLVTVTGSDGLIGTLNDIVSDSGRQTVLSKGPVDLLLPDGTTIVAETMLHEGDEERWTFTRATVVVPDLPEEEQ